MRCALILVALLVGCKKGDGGDSAADAGPVPEAVWPEWAWHHWVWEDESTQQSALDLVDGYLERDIPVGAIIIDSPWATGYSTFEWDPELFPDPQGMVDELHDKGVRVFVWTVPAINTDSVELYEEGEANGYFMQADAGSGPAVIDWWKGEGSLIDYFNPEAVDWWHGLVDNTLDLGIDGWKCDGLDFSSLFAPYSPGAGADIARLDYSHAYYRDFYDYTRERLGDDRLVTARPIDNYGIPIGGDDVAFAPIDINFAAWVGDQDASFDGLRAALMNMAYSAEYGYLAFGSDIGGYREDLEEENDRSRELFLRWTQVGAFNPVMENGGGGEHRPWAWDDETVDIYRDFVELHYAMLPYLMREGAVRFAEGRSLMTFLDTEDYRYLLGNDVFVQPILDDGTTVEVTFPTEGSWEYLFDESAVYEAGETVTLEVPLSEFSVFVRQGSEIADTLL